MPDKLQEMQELFLLEAAKYNVFPLDNSILERLMTPRPSATAGRNVFTYSGVISGLPTGDAPSILNKSYTITAEIEVPADGGDGMLVTTGGKFAGYGLYLLKGKPVFLYNFMDMERFRWEGPDALAPGKHTIVFDFTSDGPGMAKGGSGVLKVDGKEVASQKIPHTVPASDAVGRDLRCRRGYPHRRRGQGLSGSFRFTGEIAEADGRTATVALARTTLPGCRRRGTSSR